MHASMFVNLSSFAVQKHHDPQRKQQAKFSLCAIAHHHQMTSTAHRTPLTFLLHVRTQAPAAHKHLSSIIESNLSFPSRKLAGWCCLSFRVCLCELIRSEFSHHGSCTHCLQQHECDGREREAKQQTAVGWRTRQRAQSIEGVPSSSVEVNDGREKTTKDKLGSVSPSRQCGRRTVRINRSGRDRRPRGAREPAPNQQKQTDFNNSIDKSHYKSIVSHPGFSVTAERRPRSPPRASLVASCPRESR